MKKGISYAILLVCLCLLLVACNNDKPCAHDFTSRITVPAGCTEFGVITFSCSLCDYTYTEPIAKLGHSFDSGVKTKAPTCEKDGEIFYSCTACPETKTEILPATGHTFGEEYIKWEPTCKDEGILATPCLNCEYERLVPVEPTTEHDFQYSGSGGPSKYEMGERWYDCTVCGKREKEYFGTFGTLDFERVRQYGYQYAQEKGFTPIYEYPEDSENVKGLGSSGYPYYSLEDHYEIGNDVYGELNRYMRNMVDRMIEKMTDGSYQYYPDQYYLFVEIYYKVDSMHMGRIYIRLFRCPLPKNP